MTGQTDVTLCKLGAVDLLLNECIRRSFFPSRTKEAKKPKIVIIIIIIITIIIIIIIIIIKTIILITIIIIIITPDLWLSMEERTLFLGYNNGQLLQWITSRERINAVKFHFCHYETSINSY